MVFGQTDGHVYVERTVWMDSPNRPFKPSVQTIRSNHPFKSSVQTIPPNDGWFEWTVWTDGLNGRFERMV
jgi:hypothetical protein